MRSARSPGRAERYVKYGEGSTRSGWIWVLTRFLVRFSVNLTPAQIRGDERVIAAYLGHASAGAA
jgi:hypothetical protein